MEAKAIDGWDLGGWVQVVGMSVDVGRFILSEEVGRDGRDDSFLR